MEMRTLGIGLIVALSCILASVLLAPTSLATSTRELYELKCSRCHEAYEPAKYSAAEWPGLVRSMRGQAALTEQQTIALGRFLALESAAADTTGAGSSVSQAPRVGGYLYTEYFRTQEETKNFDIHYLAINVSGWANESIYYYGEFELEHGGVGGTNTFVEQAYIDYWLRQELALKIGAMLTPFNRFDEFHDPLSNYTVTRPQVAREISVSAWKEVGVDLHGYVGLGGRSAVGYDLYVINGLGSGTDLRHSRQYRDNNEDKAFGGRLFWLFGDSLELGGSAYRGAWDDGGEYSVGIYGAHFLLDTAFAGFYGEYLSATSENPEPTENGEMSGYFIQASRLLASRFRPTVRYGRLDYIDLGDELGRDPDKGNKDVSELVLAFGWYPTPDVVFKIEFAFIMEGPRLEEKDNDQLGLQAAVRF